MAARQTAWISTDCISHLKPGGYIEHIEGGIDVRMAASTLTAGDLALLPAS